MIPPVPCVLRCPRGDDVPPISSGGMTMRSRKVATALPAAGVAAPFRRIALPDAYLAAGALPTLHDRYGISAGAMRRAKIRPWVG